MLIFNKKIPGYIIFGIIISIYLIPKAFGGGNDINVYLHASKQLFEGKNIYTENPFNDYLYSPFFALILRPLSIFNMEIARVFWALTNLILAIRLWKIGHQIFLKTFKFSKKQINIWTIGVAFISLGFLNHNFILGQITILILWLTIEGLHQILIKKKTFLGSVLLSFGVIIKIIPLLALFYLFFKSKYKALIICGACIVFNLFIPSVIVGPENNLTLLENWVETINPTKSKYVFENSSGTQSLNSVIPAYFYDFKEEISTGKLPRRIFSIPQKPLLIVLQITRVTLLLSLLYLIFYHRKKRENKPLYYFWEISYLALLTVLIFPHQEKYAMLYFAPAGAYFIALIILAISLKWKTSTQNKIIAASSMILMFVSALMGRDIVGSNVVNIFDYYHGFGLINIVSLTFLIAVPPNKLLSMNEERLKIHTK